jgi:hypothetical protein
MAVSDSSPRASAGVTVKIPQMLTLADGAFFPPDRCAISWGRASRPADLAPEALKECAYSFKAFSQRRHCARRLFQPASVVSYARVEVHVCLVHLQ